ncbi:acyltransferase family protein [Shewanella baltica]|uniref:acyltransferase family protein n=1 Tax=Shewanella baltica TaxID=62322 RepID=UPI003D05E160
MSLISFLVCIVAGSFLTKMKAFAFLTKRNSRFESVDGLRGILALSVLFHHFVITYYWKTSGTWTRPPEDYYQNYGKVGVAIFFMITGFLFISKILHSKEKIDWFKIYESRIFRIFPLYLFALAFISAIVFHNSSYQLKSDFLEIIRQHVKWMMFQGGSINNYKETNLIIAGVDWTLKYEWLFYISLPFVSIALWKGNKYTSFFLAAIILFFNLYPATFVVYPNAYFSTEYFILFAIGGFVSHIAKNHKIDESIIKSKSVSMVVLMLILGCIFYPKTLGIIHIIIMSLFFFLVVLGNDLFGLLQLKSTKLLGEISYSIYLLHGLVLYILFTQLSVVDISKVTPQKYSMLMPVVSILVVLVSSVTFIFIEKKFIDFGRKYLFSRRLSSLMENANKALQRTSR